MHGHLENTCNHETRFLFNVSVPRFRETQKCHHLHPSLRVTESLLSFLQSRPGDRCVRGAVTVRGRTRGVPAGAGLGRSRPCSPRRGCMGEGRRGPWHRSRQGWQCVAHVGGGAAGGGASKVPVCRAFTSPSCEARRRRVAETAVAPHVLGDPGLRAAWGLQMSLDIDVQPLGRKREERHGPCAGHLNELNLNRRFIATLGPAAGVHSHGYGSL